MAMITIVKSPLTIVVNSLPVSTACEKRMLRSAVAAGARYGEKRKAASIPKYEKSSASSTPSHSSSSSSLSYGGARGAPKSMMPRERLVVFVESESAERKKPRVDSISAED